MSSPTLSNVVKSKLTFAGSSQIYTIAVLNELELELPPFSFPDKPAEFMEKFPYGKIPAFEGADGFKMIEGTPIARYRELHSLEISLHILSRFSVQHRD